MESTFLDHFLFIHIAYLVFSLSLSLHLNIPTPSTIRILQEASSTNNPCSHYTDCFSCSSPSIIDSHCVWSGGKCTQSYALSTSSWYNKLSTCTDEDSIQKEDLYCGDLIVDERVSELSGENLYGDESTENLFCSWVYIKTSKKPLNVMIEKKNDCYLGIEVLRTGNSTFYEITKESTFEDQFINYNAIKIYYFGEGLLNEEPFELEIEVSKFFSFSQIALYLVIAIGISFFLTSLFMLGFFCQKFLRRSTSQKNENKKKSFSHLCIKFTEYDSKIKIFNKKCPICLEDITPKEKIGLLLCKHGFHEKCIKEWITKDEMKNVFCPICHKAFELTKEKTEKRELMQTLDSPTP